MEVMSAIMTSTTNTSGCVAKLVKNGADSEPSHRRRHGLDGRAYRVHNHRHGFEFEGFDHICGFASVGYAAAAITRRRQRKTGRSF